MPGGPGVARCNACLGDTIQTMGGSQLLLVSIAVIVVTFAALEWREAHELQHARAHRRRREWPAAPPPADSCGNPVREIGDSPRAALGSRNRRGR